MTVHRTHRAAVLSAAVLFASFFMLAASLYRVVRPSAPRGATSEPAVLQPPLPAEGLAEQALELIAERDPFSPDRGNPPDSVDEPRAEPVEAVPTIVALGTVVLDEDRGLAMLREEGGSARLVRIGQTFATLTLERVEPGRALLRAGDGTQVVIPVRKQ